MTFPDDRQASHKTVDPGENATYRRIVSEFPAACVVVGRPNGSTVAAWIGADAARVFGYDVSELEADVDLWINIVHPADRARVLDAYRRLAEGAQMHEEYRIYRKDGQMRWIGETIACAQATTETLVRSIRCITDISQLKQVEAALRTSEEFLRRRYDAISAGVIVHDREGRIVYANNAAGDILNLLPEQMLAKTAHDTIWQFVREDGSPLPADEFPPYVATRTGKPVRAAVTGVFCGQSEECRWVLMNSEPILDPATGELTEVINTFVDITEREQAEQALAESEERYHSLVDNVDAVIFQIDLEGRPIALYGSVAEKTGYSIAEFMETPSLWNARIHPDDLERVRASYQEIASTGEPRAIELRIVQRSGVIRWVRVHATARYDGEEKLIYFDAVGLDISERVEAQQREAKRAARIAALADMSQAFTSPLDSQQILDVAIQTLCEELDSLSLGITFEPSTGRLLHMSICCPWECDVESLDRAINPSHVTIADVFGAEGIKPVLVTDMRFISGVAARFADAAGLGPGILAPVTAGEGAAGVIISARPPGQEFDQEELWFLTEGASHASTALANAALYKRQAQIAETLQRSLMPGKPVIGSLDVATLYSPAPGEAEVGGDFLDIFPLDHDRVGLVVGDVSGKGLEAAIHTAEAKYMLRAFVHQNSAPSYVMSSLNQALCSYLPDETFITLTYFVIDAHKHTVSYVNAGHEISLVLCRDDNALEEIRPSGPVLGVITDATYDTGHAPLEPDDTLFCYTDGVTDVRVNGERFGYDRLRETVAVAPPGDAQSLMDYVMSEVQSCGPCTQTDDQVIVVVRSVV